MIREKNGKKEKKTVFFYFGYCFLKKIVYNISLKQPEVCINGFAAGYDCVFVITLYCGSYMETRQNKSWQNA